MILSFLISTLVSLALHTGWPETSGGIISSSSAGGLTVGLTDKGELVSSRDGSNWTVVDFNTAYSGFYREVTFTCVCTSGRSICAAGVYDDGTPVAFFSTRGSVWNERPLTYKTGGQTHQLWAHPEGAYYEEDLDRFVLECEEGVLFFLPNCSHCNSIGFKEKSN